MEEKDLILFAADLQLTDIDKRTTPVELLNLQRIAQYPTEMETVQGLINALAAELSKYGYHLWTSDKYIKKNTEN